MVVLRGEAVSYERGTPVGAVTAPVPDPDTLPQSKILNATAPVYLSEFTFGRLITLLRRCPWSPDTHKDALWRRAFVRSPSLNALNWGPKLTDAATLEATLRQIAPFLRQTPQKRAPKRGGAHSSTS